MSHDWQAEAAKAMRYVRDNLLSAHRGAIFWTVNDDADAVVIFGNDGFGDDKVTQTIEAVRQQLAEEVCAEMAFATDDEGCSWVLLVELESPLGWAGKDYRTGGLSVDFTELVWQAYRNAVGATIAAEKKAELEAYCLCQREIAFSTIAKAFGGVAA